MTTRLVRWPPLDLLLLVGLISIRIFANLNLFMNTTGAVAGAVISVLLFIGTIATIVYLVQKEHMPNPLDGLKEKLGKKKVHVAENGANAELATAKPA